MALFNILPKTSRSISPARSSEIKQLRQQYKNPAACLTISYEDFDHIADLLLQSSEFESSVELLATISNIILINRTLHSSYFTPKYSNNVLSFLDRFIKTNLSHLKEVPEDYDFEKLVPVYRLTFLILYDGIDGYSDELVREIYNLLIIGFKFCDGMFTKFKYNGFYKMAFSEIVKSLYTMNHKYKYGGDLIMKENLSYSVVITVNQGFSYVADPRSFSVQGQQLLRNMLNFLLGIFTVNNTVELTNEYKRNFVAYKLFFEHLVTLLEVYFERLSKPDFEITDLTNVVFILSFSHKKIVCQYNESTDDDDRAKLRELHDVFLGFLPKSPTDNSNSYYMVLVDLVFNPVSVNITGGSSISRMTHGSYLKKVTLQFLYDISWSPEVPREEVAAHQMRCLLDYVGYPAAELFITSSGLEIPPEIDLNRYLRPNPNYLDHSVDTSGGSRGVLNSILSDGRRNMGAHTELTEEEKEAEAEKLFTVFDRMEKLGTFKGFQNPVRTWQQQGQFEELEKDC